MIVPTSHLRIDISAYKDIPIGWHQLAAKIVVSGKVTKNRFGPTSASLGMPLDGPNGVLAPITQREIDHEEPGGWVYLSVNREPHAICVKIARDDDGHAAEWASILRQHSPASLPILVEGQV